MAIALDLSPFARGGSVAICSVSAMHAVQGVLMLGAHVTAQATSLMALTIAFRAMHAPDGIVFMSCVMLATAFLAFVASMFRLGWVRIVLFVPQHFLLGIMTAGAIYAAWRGAYLDGTVKPWNHILGDQLAIIALFVVHSSAIVRRCRDPNG